MADQFTHTGNSPPGLKIKTKMEINPSTLMVLPPQSPAQPDLVPRFDILEDEQFVDLQKSTRNHNTTTTHNISCTQSAEEIPNLYPNVVHSGLFGLPFCSYDQPQHQTSFYSLPHSRKRKHAWKSFQVGPQLKLFHDASCEEETTLKKSPPVPACLGGFSFQEQRAVHEGPKQLCTQEPITLKKTFKEGKVVLGTTEALHDLVQSIGKLGKTTGVICDEDLNPVGDQYEKDAHFIVEKCFRQGSFGTVNLAIDSNRQKTFVLKRVSKDSFAKNEVLIMSTLNQANITRLYGLIHRVGPEGEHMELLIEHAGMSLSKYRARYPNMAWREEVVWDFCKQGFKALEHMDKFGIIHQDIKPDTVCITDQNDGFLLVKIRGFEHTKIVGQPLNIKGPTCTPEYFSPETCKLIPQNKHKQNFGLSNDDVSGKSDVFAFGLVIIFVYMGYDILPYAITNGHCNYNQFSPMQRDIYRMMPIVKVADGNFSQSLIPDICPKNMKMLLSIMLECDIEKRGSASYLLTLLEKTVLQPVVDVKNIIQSDENRFPKTFLRNPSSHQPINDWVKRELRHKLQNKEAMNQKSIEDWPKCKNKKRRKQISPVQLMPSLDSQKSMEGRSPQPTRSLDSQKSIEGRSPQPNPSCGSQISIDGRSRQPTPSGDSQMSIEWRPDTPTPSGDSKMFIEGRSGQPTPSCQSQSSMELNLARLTHSCYSQMSMAGRSRKSTPSCLSQMSIKWRPDTPTPSCVSQMSMEGRYHLQTRSSDCLRSMERIPETFILYPPMHQPTHDAVKRKLGKKLKKNADMNQKSIEDRPKCKKKRTKQVSPDQQTHSDYSQMSSGLSDKPIPSHGSHMSREGRPEQPTLSCASQRSIGVNPVCRTRSQDPQTSKERSPDRPITYADPPSCIEGVPNFELICPGIDKL